MIIRRKHWYPDDVCPRCKGVVCDKKKIYWSTKETIHLRFKKNILC